MLEREVTIDLIYYNDLLKTQFENNRTIHELSNANVEILNLKDKIDKIMKYANEHLMTYQIETLQNIIDDVPEEQ